MTTPWRSVASGIDDLELPGDDDDMIVLDDSADVDDATVMQEDDFNLTPLEQTFDDDSESSGSQVVALEDSELYADDDAATILGEAGEFDAEPALVDDGFGDDEAYLAPGAVGAAAAVTPRGALHVVERAEPRIRNVPAVNWRNDCIRRRSQYVDARPTGHQ